MLEQYAIVPYRAQVERFPLSKPREPAGLSQQYGRLRLCFLEP
jgi:hypothetical protein